MDLLIISYVRQKNTHVRVMGRYAAAEVVAHTHISWRLEAMRPRTHAALVHAHTRAH